MKVGESTCSMNKVSNASGLYDDMLGMYKRVKIPAALTNLSCIKKTSDKGPRCLQF